MRAIRNIGLLTMLATLAVPVTRVEARQYPRTQIVIRSAYDEGFRDGFRVGQDHGRRGAGFGFSSVVEYRRGDDGYSPSLGTREQYRDDYRFGFERGYREGYDQFAYARELPPPPIVGARERGVGVYSDVAMSNGYRDGYAEGLNDGKHHHQNDPYAESRFKSGDHGYEGWYGKKDVYRIHYRDGFRDGYERGYADGWRR